MLDFKEQLLNIQKNNISHFYIIYGNPKKNKKTILDFLKLRFSFKCENNLDFFNFKGLSLPLEKVRKIKKINSITKNNEKDWRIFFLNYKQISGESQNALLKTLEEPQEKTIFFLFISENLNLLDTIKSRAQILNGENIDDKKQGDYFLKLSYVDRIKFIKNLEKEKYYFFLDSLELAIVNNKDKIKDFSEVYNNFIELKSQSQNRGAGINYVLEFLALYL